MDTTRTDTDGKEASEDGGQAKAVAVVFIHGVGVQDRYQQLTAFSNGLTETPTPHFTVTTRTAANGRNLPRGRFVPLRVEGVGLGGEYRASVAVDVHEVYWAPLLNGLIKPAGVLQWAALVLARAKPSRGTRIALPPRRKSHGPPSTRVPGPRPGASGPTKRATWRPCSCWSSPCSAGSWGRCTWRPMSRRPTMPIPRPNRSR